jgi:hypothetical protein
MAVTTGKPQKVLSQWSTKITVEFVQVPAEKREAYWAALAWFAEEIRKDLTVPEAAETVNG